MWKFVHEAALIACLAKDADGVQNPRKNKGKRMGQGVDHVNSIDANSRKILQGSNSKAISPGKKTWLRQLFAGQMGLTFLAAMMGMAVAAPRDLAEGWNAATKKGQTQYTADIEHERPYVECFTPPCGAWGNFSN